MFLALELAQRYQFDGCHGTPVARVMSTPHVRYVLGPICPVGSGEHMGNCFRCGSSLPPQMRFCQNCGAPVVSRSAPPAAHMVPVGSADPPAPEADSQHGEESGATRPRRRRYLRPLSLAFLAIALLGSGFLAGWSVASDRALVPPSGIPDRSEIKATDAAGTVMPELRGLHVSDARQILADVGIGQDQVEVQSRPAVGEANTVLVQDPVYGYRLDGDVVLTVSEPAVVPDFTGRTATDVLADLEQLGAAVKTVSRYVPGVAAGDVASIRPAPGSAAPDTVTVVIATAPETLALAEIEAVEDNCYVDAGNMNTESYTHLLTCDAYRGEDVVQSYVLNRAGSRVTGVFGVPDDAEANDVVRLQILGDGREIDVLEASYGDSTTFDVPVSGVLRLSLRVSTDDPEYATAGIGRLWVTGDATQLDRLRVNE